MDQDGGFSSKPRSIAGGYVGLVDVLLNIGLHGFTPPPCLFFITQVCHVLFNNLVGGFKHVLFSIIYGKILPNWLSYFSRWLKPPTTNQYRSDMDWPLVYRSSRVTNPQPTFPRLLWESRLLASGSGNLEPRHLCPKNQREAFQE